MQRSKYIREVHADKEMQEMLIAVEKDFWRKVINMERPEPDGSDACKNLLDSIYKGGINEQIILPDEAIEYLDMYIEATADMDSAKAKQQEASNHLKEIMDLSQEQVGKSPDELKSQAKTPRPATKKQIQYLQHLMQQHGNTEESMNR